MKLKKGIKFKSKWFQGIVEVVEVKEEVDILFVEIFRTEEHHHSEEWVLSHTIIGFENGDYTLIPICESHSDCCFAQDDLKFGEYCEPSKGCFS